jgi:hypothetical protein
LKLGQNYNLDIRFEIEVNIIELGQRTSNISIVDVKFGFNNKKPSIELLGIAIEFIRVKKY